MASWRQVGVPVICERMIGFSVPHDGTVLVVSYEGMHLLHLGPPATVETDTEYSEYDLFDPKKESWAYRGRAWELIGLQPGRPLLTGVDGEQLVLGTVAETLSVLRDGEQSWATEYENSSGDWAAATFSPDGRFILLGCPYGFDSRLYQRETGA